MREQTYTMPVKAIKHILEKELSDFKDGAYRAVKAACMADSPAELVYIGFKACEAMLKASNTYDELDEYLSFAGYRMSLQEWIDSL